MVALAVFAVGYFEYVYDFEGHYGVSAGGGVIGGGSETSKKIAKSKDGSKYALVSSADADAVGDGEDDDLEAGDVEMVRKNNG